MIGNTDIARQLTLEVRCMSPLFTEAFIAPKGNLKLLLTLSLLVLSRQDLF